MRIWCKSLFKQCILIESVDLERVTTTSRKDATCYTDSQYHPTPLLSLMCGAQLPVAFGTYCTKLWFKNSTVPLAGVSESSFLVSLPAPYTVMEDIAFIQCLYLTLFHSYLYISFFCMELQKKDTKHYTYIHLLKYGIDIE